ncbi:MAG: extracellular solute-binding protein [Deltaproteobacteria bacterium]|nr:extracellular solute-binding protein [Deltaproteobacteria bacterium]
MKRVLVFLLLSIGMVIDQSAKAAVPTTLAELAKYAGADRERILYEGAKKEGKLVWYTSLVPHKEIAKLFTERYPGVAVDIYRADGVLLSSRITAETQARRHLFDAIETTPPPLMPLRDEQMLMPYYSPHHRNYPEHAKEKASGNLTWWSTDRESLIGVGYNTKAFPAAELPKRFDDLLKPYLKGKMSVANNETGARAIGAMIKAKGEDFVRRLKEQEVRPHATSAAGLADMIIRGEVPISFTMVQTNLTQPAASRGAPVAWVPMEIVAVNAGGAAVSANAPHPHAALLFTDFLLSPQGQKMYAEKLFYTSAAKKVNYEKWYPEKGLTTAEYDERSQAWLKLLREITRK